MNDEKLNKLAKFAYQIYGETTDFKNFLGNPMPDFDELPELTRTAWRNTAMALYTKGRVDKSAEAGI